MQVTVLEYEVKIHPTLVYVEYYLVLVACKVESH